MYCVFEKSVQHLEEICEGQDTGSRTPFTKLLRFKSGTRVTKYVIETSSVEHKLHRFKQSAFDHKHTPLSSPPVAYPPTPMLAQPLDNTI